MAVKLTTNPGIKVTVVSTGDISKHRFVNYAGATCGDGLKARGASIEWDSVSGDHVPIIINGTAILTAGAAVTVGAAVASDSTGRAVPVGEGEETNGWAVTAASGANVEMVVQLA